jgi:AraC-like DNA-binding protein
MKARYVLGGYAEWPVPPGIAHVVEASWSYWIPPSRAGGETAPTVHRVLPYNGVSLVVWGAGRWLGDFQPLGLQLQGASESYRFFRPEPGEAMVAVRLRAEWVRAVLGVEAKELRGHIVEIGDAPGWRTVLARLRRSRRATAVLASLERFVHDRLGEVSVDGAGITAHRALERLRHDPSSARVTTLAAAAGVSERTLRRSVTSLTGMSPKWIQRVERLSKAVTAADALRRPPWSDLAFRFGFSDQAHLVREAGALTHCTPTTLHRERWAQRPAYGGSASHA